MLVVFVEKLNSAKLKKIKTFTTDHFNKTSLLNINLLMMFLQKTSCSEWDKKTLHVHKKYFYVSKVSIFDLWIVVPAVVVVNRKWNWIIWINHNFLHIFWFLSGFS